MSNDIYRGYTISKKPNGLYEWTDERGFVHTGTIDLTEGYVTTEDAMNDIDAYKRRMRAAQ